MNQFRPYEGFQASPEYASLHHQAIKADRGLLQAEQILQVADM